MVNNNKGFFSFWLLLFFLTGFTARNFVYTLPQNHKTEAAHHIPSGKPVVSLLVSGGASQSLLDQLQDSDSDDIEVSYYADIVSKNITLPVSEHEFAEFAPYNSIYRVPLYDLYCNWKFHLI